MEKYYQSKQVNSVDEFKKLFLDVVHGHRCAYERVGGLHRDLSINNVMFSRRGEEVAGILWDWDLTIFVDEASDGWDINDAHVSSPSVGGGTSLQLKGTKKLLPTTSKIQIRRKRMWIMTGGPGPYMAIDLLVLKEAPRHVYHHDLESFFFVFAWFCAAFVPEEHAYDHWHQILETWEEGTFEQIGRAKLRLLRGRTYDALVKTAAKPYKVLLSQFVRPLIRPLFQTNVSHMALISDLQLQLFMSKITTIEFEKEIEKLGQQRDSIINYYEFIRALQV